MIAATSLTNTNIDNVKIVSQVDNYSKWKLFTTSEGKYFFESKAGIGRVLNIPSTAQDDLLQLKCLGSSDLNGSYWTFIPNLFMLYSVDYPDEGDEGHYHTGQVLTIKNMVQNYSINAVMMKNQNLSPTSCRIDLENCDVFVSRSHGSYERSVLGTIARTCIVLDSGNLYSHSPLLIEEGSDSLSSSDDYSNLRIALFVACYTGIGGVGGNNLPSAIVEHGAETAVGFTDSINCALAREWTNTFVGWVLAGYSVQEAFEAAEALSGLDCGILCGNRELVLDN